jgi:anti-sigma factor RsiW
MKCRDMLGSLSDYIDGELEERLCAEIEAHMKDCPDCRVMVDTLRKTVVLYRTHGRAEMPADVRSRLHAVVNLEALQADHGQGESS